MTSQTPDDLDLEFETPVPARPDTATNAANSGDNDNINIDHNLDNNASDNENGEASSPHAASTQTKAQSNTIRVDLPIVEKLRFYTDLKENFPTQILLSNRSICKFLGVAPTSARRALKNMPRRLRNAGGKGGKGSRFSLENPGERDPRGRGNILTEEHIRAMVRFLEEGAANSDANGDGTGGMTIPPWVELARLVGVQTDISQRTVKRSMSLQGYRKCAKCYKMLLRPEIRAMRTEICRSMKQWGETELRNVRWTTTWHFGLNEERKAIVMSEEVRDEYCEPCIYTSTLLAKRDQICEARWHCWGMVGWDYKSDLYFFETPSGRLDEQTYYQILERMVLMHAKENPDIILEEDMDAAHGATNLVPSISRFFKEQHSIKSYYTAPHCPEITPLREIWNSVKGKVDVKDWYGQADIRDAIIREWDRMTQEQVNKEIFEAVGRAKVCFVD